MWRSGLVASQNKLHFQFRAHGPSRNLGVLYLHGFMGHLQEMQPLVALGVDSLLLDLPGHGESLEGELLSWQGFARELRQLLSSLAVKEWIFYGYSMGGRLLLEYLKCYGGKGVRLLILESVSPGLAGESERQERRHSDELLAQELEQLSGVGGSELSAGEAIKERAITAFLHRWYQQDLFQGMNSHPQYPDYIAQKKMANIAHWAQALRVFSLASQRPCFEALPAVQGVYLCGQKDAKYHAYGEQFRRQWGWPLYCLRGASHNPHFTAAAQVTKLLWDNIAAIAGTG